MKEVKINLEKKKTNAERFCELVIVIITAVITPVLLFVFAYIGGLILNWVVGGQIVNGLNIIFNTTRFTRDLIPLTCGTLAVIGSYFKTSSHSKNDDE